MRGDSPHVGPHTTWGQGLSPGDQLKCESGGRGGIRGGERGDRGRGEGIRGRGEGGSGERKLKQGKEESVWKDIK